MRHEPPSLLALAEAHRQPTRLFTADGLATAWYALAPLPSGRWAVQFGVWAQGDGTVDHPWAEYDGRAECLLRFLGAAEDLCTRETPGLAPAQENARAELLARLDAHAEEVA